MTDYRIFVEDYAKTFGYNKFTCFSNHIQYYKYSNSKFVTLTHINDDKYVTFSGENATKVFKSGDLFLSILENSEIEDELFS
jgi:hypothetical protein